MRKNLNLAALLLVLVFAGCKKDVQSEAVTELPQAAKAAPTSARNVYLEVKIIDGVGKIISDGNGTYIDGQDKVGALIWDNGDFYMNTNNNAARAPIRRLWFTNAGFTDIPLLPTERLNNVRNHRMRTQYVEGISGQGLIQNMTFGQTKTVGFFIWGEEPAGVFDWKLRFQYYQDRSTPSAVSSTDYAEIKKVGDAGADDTKWDSEYPGRNVWVLQPLGIYRAHIQDGKNDPGITNYYQVPFQFKLIEKVR